MSGLSRAHTVCRVVLGALHVFRPFGANRERPRVMIPNPYEVAGEVKCSLVLRRRPRPSVRSSRSIYSAALFRHPTQCEVRRPDANQKERSLARQCSVLATENREHISTIGECPFASLAVARAEAIEANALACCMLA